MRAPGRHSWIALLAVTLAALPGLVFTIDPAARDQGVFATIAWQWLAGGVPYVSAGVEHKGPLPFAAYALSQLLFGHSIGAARLLAWLSLLLSGLLVAGIGRRLLRCAWAGTAAGVVYVLVAGCGGLSAWWSGAQAEAFMEPLAAGAILASLVAVDRRSGRLAMLAGALLGAASLGKPTAFLLIPAILATGVGALPGGAIRFGTGLAAPWLVTLAGLALAGAAPAFVDSVFLVNLDYGGRGLALLPRRLPQFLATHAAFIPWLLLPVALVGGARAVRERPAPGARLLLFWILGAYAQVVVQGRFFGYHFHPVVGPLALAVGWALAGGGRGSPAPAGPVGPGPLIEKGALIALTLAAMVLLSWGEVGLRLGVLRGRTPVEAFHRHLSPPGGDFDVDPGETIRVAEWFERNSRPDETLLVWGFEPAVNFLARRRCPTRFLYDYYLTARSIAPERQQRYWTQFWSDLDRSPPDWIAVVHGDTNPVEGKDSAAQLAAEPRLREYLAKGYDPEVRLGDFEIFHRRREARP